MSTAAQVRTYSVPSISCGHCQAAIEGEVSGVAGVDSVTVDIAARTVRVVGEASDEAIRAAIDEAGHDVAGVLPEPDLPGPDLPGPG